MSQEWGSEPVSEDANAMVAQVLNQFQGSHTCNIASSNPQDQNPEETHEALQSQQPRAMNHSIGIVVPTVDHESDYEYLPGHFAVRRILKLHSENPQKPSYTIRLQSGEQQTVRTADFIEFS